MQQFIKKFLIYIGGLFILYCACLMLFSFSPIQAYVTNLKLSKFQKKSEKISRTFQRIDSLKVEPDVLVLGSSHAEVSFDPRYFKQNEINIINLGTSSQGPVQSYYLFKDYLSKHKPKYLLLENYFFLYSDQPNYAEGTFYLLSALPYSHNLLDMSIMSTKDITSINTLAALYMRKLWIPLNKVPQEKIPADFRLIDGYIERYTDSTKQKAWLSQGIAHLETKKLLADEVQFEYLHKIIALAKSKNIPIIFVETPMPIAYIQKMEGYEKIVNEIANIAKENNIPYFNFNRSPLADSLQFDMDRDFYDDDHLSHQGTIKFSPVLIHQLSQIIK